jgi:hypothetical protein
MQTTWKRSQTEVIHIHYAMVHENSQTEEYCLTRIYRPVRFDGGIYEPVVDPTIKQLQNADHEYIIPCH